MVEIEIIGNVGAQAQVQVKQYSNGDSYVRFSVYAEHGRGDKKRTDLFTVYYDCKPDFAQYITQGRRLLVKGEYSDGAYSQEGNVLGVNRYIKARLIEFIGGGNGNKDGNNGKPAAPSAPVAPSAPSAPVAPKM